MEQLIFIGIIVAFSILDAIAKKKRKEAQEEIAYEPVPDGGPAPWEPPDAGPPVYDTDSSYDDPDGDGIPGEPLPQYTHPYGSESPANPRGSEGLIPKDVWEEIAALASGRPMPEPAPLPVPYEAPVPLDPRRPEQVPARPDHRIHDAHARYGQPVSQRLTALDMPEDHVDRGASAEVRQAKRLLTGGAASLRQAVILQELLGPPVSLRED